MLIRRTNAEIGILGYKRSKVTIYVDSQAIYKAIGTRITKSILGVITGHCKIEKNATLDSICNLTISKGSRDLNIYIESHVVRISRNLYCW